jgi:hypothetical protein
VIRSIASLLDNGAAEKTRISTNSAALSAICLALQPRQIPRLLPLKATMAHDDNPRKAHAKNQPPSDHTGGNHQTPATHTGAESGPVAAVYAVQHLVG